MMTSQILKSVDFIKTQKSRCLKNEIIFFLQPKSSLITHQGLPHDKKNFKAVVTFKLTRKKGGPLIDNIKATIS